MNIYSHLSTFQDYCSILRGELYFTIGNVTTIVDKIVVNDLITKISEVWDQCQSVKDYFEEKRNYTNGEILNVS